MTEERKGPPPNFGVDDVLSDRLREMDQTYLEGKRALEYRALLERVGHERHCETTRRSGEYECNCIRREIQAKLGKEGDHAA